MHSAEHAVVLPADVLASKDPWEAGVGMDGRVERLFHSISGYTCVLGWLSDEGNPATEVSFPNTNAKTKPLITSLLRHSRPDVETHIGREIYDYGFIAFGKLPIASLPAMPAVTMRSGAASLTATPTPERVSDKRLLDALLAVIQGSASHEEKELQLRAFLAGPAGDTIVGLFRSHVEQALAGHHVERFRPRRTAYSLVTVLFGTAEPMLLQPVLFRRQGIDDAEWIYVCNSPEDAAEALRLGRMMSDLYDLTITVITVADNVGFGAANNLAVEQATSDRIFLVNPDVYPLASQGDRLRQALAGMDLGHTLWGGLLFYDEAELMHGGMYIDNDVVVPRYANAPRQATGAIDLLRVEHFDKGVPFDPSRWNAPVTVPAVSGAVMAFDRRAFTAAGGFSTRYIYGHYEDADLSLRWADKVGPVAVAPDLRLAHLEGQGSRPRGEQYRGAMFVNRHFFSIDHAARYRASPERLRHVGAWTPAAARQA